VLLLLLKIITFMERGLSVKARATVEPHQQPRKRRTSGKKR
jgi:hypothetical protein